MIFNPHFFTCLLLVLITSTSCSQEANESRNVVNDFSKFVCEYLTMDYPTNWKVIEEQNRLLFYLPKEPGRHLASPSFHITFQGRDRLQNWKILFENQKDFPTPQKNYFKEEIAGKTAMAYRWEGGSNVVNIRYWFGVAPQKDAMIHIAGYSDHLDLHWPLFEAVKKSIRLIKQPPSSRAKIIEVTNQQLTEDWLRKTIPLGSTGKKISKLEEMIRELWSGENVIRIVDEGIEITNWTTFFAWKSSSVIKDVQIYSYYQGIGDQLNIFSQQVYLGDYDYLFIEELKVNHLQFEFTKSSGEKVKWILEIEDNHALPLNQKINLDRFTFQKETSFKHSERLTGEVITFAINGSKYTLRLKMMDVF